MTRSSRHKSSKHSSKDAREHSDSEKDSGFKEKKGREESGGGGSSRAGKESASAGEKRKIDSKSGDNIVDEYGGSSSKKRKEKVDDDRWTGGEDERGTVKGDGHWKSKSSRKEENAGMGFDTDEGKRSGSKGESKHHHRSDRKDKDEKEHGSERERKGKEVTKIERSVNCEASIDVSAGERSAKVESGEDPAGKPVACNTGSNVHDDVSKSGHEKELERRVRRKRDSFVNADRHLDGVHDVEDKRISYRDDYAKLGKYKDDLTQDKYDDDFDKDSRRQDEKPRDGRYPRDYTGSKSDDKCSTNEKKESGMLQKKHRSNDRDPDHERTHQRRDHHDNERERDDRDHDRHRDRNHERHRDRGRDREQERDRDQDWERERDLDHDRVRDTYRRERDRDHHDRDHTLHLDNRSSRYKEESRKRKSPEYYDDYRDDRSRSEKTDYYRNEKTRSGKVDDYYDDKSRDVKLEGEADGERSLSRKGPLDNISGNSRGLSTPNSKSHTLNEKYRDASRDDSKLGDSTRDAISFSEAHEKVSQYRPMDKRSKFDSNYIGDPASEKNPGTAVSPMRMKDGSPSSSGVDSRYVNRTVRRHSLDVDEAERRRSSSIDVRDVSGNEDRPSRGLSSKKPFAEEYFQVESPFYHRSVQGNAYSHNPARPGFGAGADSPFLGSFGEEGRARTPNRYRRSVDPNTARSHMNPWKGVANWAPMPNGFGPFPPGPHGLPPGGFPGMMPPFPSPHIFGVRPSMEMSHPGLPYMSEADRFSARMRPLGWPNMVDGRGPHFPGWEANSGVSRDESPMFGPGHLLNGSVRELDADLWKQNGDMNMGFGPGSEKDENKPMISSDEAFLKPEAKGSRGVKDPVEDLGIAVDEKSSDGFPTSKESPAASMKVDVKKSPESPEVSTTANYLHVYISKLDVSVELALPELYNQCMSLEVEKQHEDDEALEVTFLEDSSAAGLEVLDLSTKIPALASVEDSIFQRAMGLYNAESSKIAWLQKLHYLPSLRGGEGDEHIPVLEDGVEKQILVSDQEMEDHPSGAVDSNTQLVSTTAHTRVDGALPPAVEVEENQLSPKSSKMEIHALTPEIPEASGPALIDENMTDRPPSPELVDRSHQCVEESSPLDTKSKGSMNAAGKDGDSEASCGEAQMGSKVSVSMSAPVDSGSVGSVCEAVMSVSNEPESVDLTRIHPPAESTHSDSFA